ncbi:14764_t:CDS:2 [Funneliformis geosporum]|nr:14764_t:CDS:2 [Funneliformis geosporum]
MTRLGLLDEDFEVPEERLQNNSTIPTQTSPTYSLTQQMQPSLQQRQHPPTQIENNVVPPFPYSPTNSNDPSTLDYRPTIYQPPPQILPLAPNLNVPAYMHHPYYNPRMYADPEYWAKFMAEEDKRKRNTAASARFRVKKKMREQSLEKTARDMSEKAEMLENRVKELEREIKWLKNLLIEKDSRISSIQRSESNRGGGEEIENSNGRAKRSDQQHQK